MDAFPHQDGLLMALRASLPGKDLHFAELDSPPRNVLLLRLSRILVKEAEKRLKPVDHVTHLGEPATKLLGAKFSRLAPYFEGLTVADVAQVSPEDLWACAAPHDKVHMRLLINHHRELFTRTDELLRQPHGEGTTVATTTKRIVDFSGRFVGSDTTYLKAASIKFDCTKLMEDIELECGGKDNVPLVRSLNLSNCRISDKDYADLVTFLTSPDSPLSYLENLLLENCQRLGGSTNATDTHDDACKTTVKLLKHCKKLTLGVVFDTSLINIDNKERLFDQLDLSDLRRLIWMPKEWLSQQEEEEVEDLPIWSKLLDKAAEKSHVTLSEAVKKVIEAHSEYFFAQA